MRTSENDPPTKFEILADFRYAIRRFLHFSEDASSRAGVHPQQYQLLLQIQGAEQGTLTTIGYVSKRLNLRHNSVVELSKRCEHDGLIERVDDPLDKRHVVLHVSPKGLQLLNALAEAHARELHELAPELIDVLTRIRRGQRLALQETKGSTFS